MLTLPIVAAAAAIAAGQPAPAPLAPVIVVAPNATLDGRTLTLSGAGAREKYAAALTAARRPGGALAVIQVRAAGDRRDAIAVRLSQPRWDAKQRRARFTVERVSSTAGTGLAHLDDRLDSRVDTTAGRATITIAPAEGAGGRICTVRVENGLPVDLQISAQIGADDEWRVPPPAQIAAGASAQWTSRGVYDRGCKVTTTASTRNPYPELSATLTYELGWAGDVRQVACAPVDQGQLTCWKPPVVEGAHDDRVAVFSVSVQAGDGR